MPKVSICMPNYNHSLFLPEAIESVISQSYSDYEFIIIDNCSTDRSVEVIEKYSQQDRRISYKVNKSNIGPVENINLCLTYAKGDYIKYLFSDDAFVSNRAVEEMVSVLNVCNNVSLVASKRNVIDDKSNIIKVTPSYRRAGECPGIRIINDCLIEQRNMIGEPSAVMFRRKHAIRGFDTRYRQIVDLEMWFHLLEQGDFFYIDKPLCSFRSHPNQQTQINIAQRALSDEAFQLLEDYANKPYIHLSSIKREYMFFVPVYAVWKQYKKNEITMRCALDKIKKHYRIFHFFLFYPVFKIYRLVRSMPWLRWRLS